MLKQTVGRTVKYSKYPSLFSRKRKRGITQKHIPLRIQVQGNITLESIQLRL